MNLTALSDAEHINKILKTWQGMSRVDSAFLLDLANRRKYEVSELQRLRAELEGYKNILGNFAHRGERK